MAHPATLRPRMAASKLFLDARLKIVVAGGMNWIRECLSLQMMREKCVQNMEIAPCRD